MKTKKLENGDKFPIQFRTLQIELREADGEKGARLDADTRVVKGVSICSDGACDRWFGTEILSHDESAIDLRRIKKKAAPLLFNHDRDALLGKLQSPRVEDGKLLVDFRFSSSPEAKQAFQDLQDGILTECSIGYMVNKYEVDEKKDIYTAIDWEIYEASLVTIPADYGVGVGRKIEEEKEIEITSKKDVDTTLKDEKPLKTDKAMSEKAEVIDPPKPELKIDVKEVENKAVTGERARVDGITEIETHLREKGIGGRKIDVSESARKFIKDGKTVDEFRHFVMTNEFKALPVTPEANGEIGLKEADIRKFSLLRACRLLASGKQLDGLEKEVSDAALKASGYSDPQDRAVYLPPEIMNHDPRSNPAFDARAFQRFAAQQRINNVTSGPAGGYTVGTEVMPMIELLRNKMVLDMAGITTLTGLQGDILFPTLTQGLTAYWVSETGTLTDSEVVFGQKAMTPHRLGATTGYTSQFLAQSSLSVEQFFRNELMTAIRLKLDNAGLEGTGVGGEPLGVKNTPGINATVTFGGAAEWGDIVEFETGIAADNADIGSMAFIISTATGGKWKTILKVTAGASGDFLVMDNAANGYPVYRTNQVTGDIVFFGVWSQLLHGVWATQEIIVDPYRLKKAGQIEITANTFHDFLVRQPLAFNVSTDTGAA